MQDLRVECETDEAGRRLPVRFGFAGGPLRAVVERLDRWEGEDHCYVRVRTDDGAIWILRWDARRDAWQLQLYDGAAAPVARPNGGQPS
ncbi:MAG TPA: hypothetical protein VMW35_09625 [Myxococcota bacterium]|jgi:hypothetical protein|nr:hypothetical protein [Myxococcota bacterium]